MKIYRKSSLELREKVYAKKNVVLKELTNVNDTQDIKKEVSTSNDIEVKQGTVSQKTQNVDALVPQNATPDQKVNAVKNAVNKNGASNDVFDVNLTPVNTSALDAATQKKVQQNIKPSTSSLFENGVRYTKKELNKMLKTL